MKKGMTLLTMALVLALGFAFDATAQSKSRTVTVSITDDVMVGETLLKKGEYRARLDFQTGDLMIMKDGDVVATAKGKVIEGSNKSRYTALQITSTDKGRLLSGLQMEGERRSLILNESTNSNVTDEK